MKKTMLAVAAATLLSLAGCTTPFNARVSRFQQLPPPNGQTFVVETTDPRLQGGIEFSGYAQMVAQEMEQHGYRQASTPASADLVVDMRYSVDHGHEKVVSDGGFGDPFLGGPFGYYGGYRYGFGFYDPFLFGPGFGPDIHSYTVYTGELDLHIDRTSDGKRVFEGTAQAHSGTDILQRIVPPLIDAMFTGFPGNSGETVRITVAPNRS